MTVRAVEGKKPYTGGKAIEITEDKVINLRLRDENNLIIWDSEDNEIYVDLQLGDEIAPTDTFPVGITTGRAIVDNGWDATGTLVCFKTTSGDNIKLFYTDSGSVFVDNGTGTFKQIYLKSEVDALLATKQNLLTAGDNITIDSNNVISSDKGIVISNTQPSDATEGLLWYNVATGKLKVYNGTDWNDLGITYTAGNGILIDQNNEISVDTTIVATQTDLDSKQDELVSGTNIKTVNSNSLLGSGDVSINEVPSGGTDGQVLTKVSGSPAWANPTGGGDVSVSTDTGNELTTGAKLWLGTTTDFSSIVNPDSNTMYIQYTSSGGGGWQPGTNTVLYAPFDVDLKDEVNGTSPTIAGGTANIVNGVAELQWAGLTYPTISSPVSNRTICFWSNMTQVPSYNPRFTTGNGWTSDMYRRSNSYIGMYWNQEQSDQWTAELNTWIMWTWTQDGSTNILYKNGIAKAYNVEIPTSVAEVHIGNPNSSGDGFYGYMSKFIVEDKTWTAQEILDYYNQTSGDYQ